MNVVYLKLLYHLKLKMKKGTGYLEKIPRYPVPLLKSRSSSDQAASATPALIIICLQLL